MGRIAHVSLYDTALDTRCLTSLYEMVVSYLLLAGSRR
jgi:hypothetical protein